MRTCFDGNPNSLVVELEQMLDNEIYTQRRQQIEICYDLDQYHRGATVIMKLKEMFNLSGNFADMEMILQSVCYLFEIE